MALAQLTVVALVAACVQLIGCTPSEDTGTDPGDDDASADLPGDATVDALADVAGDSSSRDLRQVDAGDRDQPLPADTSDDPSGPQPSGCPTLADLDGDATLIAAGDVQGLVSAINNAQPGDVIALADGTFALGGEYLWIDTPRVTLRSQSGAREAVVLDGEYETTEIVSIAASDVTIADLTLRRAYNHAVHVVGADPNVGTRLVNLHVVDPGQQGIKINQTGGLYADEGLIACSHIELTDAGRQQIRDNCYTGGIDAHRTRGWIVRDNLIEGFWCPTGLSEHGIHFWQHNADTLIERNLINNCARGIGLGLQSSGDDARDFGETGCPTDVFVEDHRGTVRNNMVFADDPALFASAAGFDNGISLASACRARVLHNTVYSTEPPFSSIEWRFDGTSADISNNLVSHNLNERTPGTAAQSGNIAGAGAEHFVDVGAGELHLAQTSTARGAGVSLAAGWCDEDIDGHPRGLAPDVGADEIP